MSSNDNKLLPEQTLDRFKYEVADHLGLLDRIAQKGWPNMPSKDCGAVGGKIGGSMVRVLIKQAEEMLIQKHE